MRQRRIDEAHVGVVARAVAAQPARNAVASTMAKPAQTLNFRTF